MAQKMTLPKWNRRVTGMITVGLCLLGAAAVHSWARTALLPMARWSGVVLLLLIVSLALFNTRKKIPFLPLVRASLWLQIHVYMGLFAVGLFLLHIDFRMPTGWLEQILAAVFIIVSISGVIGAWLTRWLPRMMRRSGEALVYERIPRYRREIRDAVEELVLRAEESCGSSTIPDFYLQHVQPYLAQKASFGLSFKGPKRGGARSLYNELEARHRYLSDAEKSLAKELVEWIGTKENLDFQEASQRLLKWWLFLHIPLSFSLIVLGFVHGFLVFIYSGL
ncbi:MAG TPA: hypothetical protein EYQ50_21490 [Verrucomicrobiales bacterium]|nr:hypothetical protein [Verrucomicrobiales bacterium]